LVYGFVFFLREKKILVPLVMLAMY